MFGTSSIVRTLRLAALVTLAASTPVQSRQTADGIIRGLVTDASAGVLPGVTVVAMAENGAILSATTTDARGGFVLNLAAPADVRLAFKLDGFTAGIVSLAVRPGAESFVVQRMSLAPVSETVVVQGTKPFEPLLPPLPAVRPVPEHDVASVCGPAKPAAASVSFGKVRARRREPDPGPSSKGERGLYVKGDQLIIEGGVASGLQVGQNVVARRYFPVMGASGPTTGEHSSGLLQIVAAEERNATAVVVYACDEIMVGDFLGAFEPEPVLAPGPAGTPAYHDAARILFGDAGQIFGVPRRMLVIDHGAHRGIHVGQRLTIFRREARSGNQPLTIGEAVVVAVRADSATIRVDMATDAISFGDWVAPQQVTAARAPSPDSP